MESNVVFQYIYTLYNNQMSIISVFMISNIFLWLKIKILSSSCFSVDGAYC